MSRLFTFGCSFTNYRWSTWADCLAPEFDHFENWGQAGGGNHYIFNSVMEADQRHQFGTGDTVIVCWTSLDREDRYVDRRWHTPGNAHFATNVFNKEYLKTHIDERGFLIRDLAYIKAVKTLLENRPGLTWRFLSMVELMARPWPDDDVSLHRDVMRLYSDVLDTILLGYDKTVFAETGWPNRNGDPHPSPDEHLAYLDAVLPGWVTKAETRVKMHEQSINLNKDPRKSGMTKVTRL
jgi:hypothetical protein